MSVQFLDTQPRPKLDNTQKLLQQLFSLQMLGLYKLIEQFGGKKLAARLDQHVIEAADNRQLNLVIQNGRVRRLETNQPWSVYAFVTQEAVDFAISVAGTRLVLERVKTVTNAIENRTRVSHFEIAFRLGLHRMKIH